jgi:hypothetical protein
MTDEAASHSERQALELLPWYVNGTLEGEEREQVRRELRSSLTCRLEYERLSRMQALMQGEDAERVATDRGFERLMARIHADGAKPAAAGFRPMPWSRLAQAAAVVVVVSAAVAWWNQDAATGPQTFRTLTTDAPAGSHAALRLVFRAGVSEDERRALLAELGLRAVAPPTADGIYTLAPPDHADARVLVERLRADSRVAIVTQPAEGAGP